MGSNPTRVIKRDYSSKAELETPNLQIRVRFPLVLLKLLKRVLKLSRRLLKMLKFKKKFQTGIVDALIIWTQFTERLVDWQICWLILCCLFFRAGPVATGSLEPLFPVGTIIVSYRTWPLILYAKLFLNKEAVRPWLARYYCSRQVVASYYTDYFSGSTGLQQHVFHKVSVLTDNNKLVISGYEGYAVINSTLHQLGLPKFVHTNSDQFLYLVVSKLRASQKIDIINPEEIVSCYLFTISNNLVLGKILIYLLVRKIEILICTLLILLILLITDSYADTDSQDE